MTNYIDIPEEEAKKRLDDIVWVAARKKPLFSQIMVGYMLAQAVWFFIFFVDKAISCIDTAVVDMNADGTPIDALEVSEPKALLYELKALVLRKEAAIHVMLAEIMRVKGYGAIANAMFRFLKIGITSR